jgi:outer membrane protein
LTPFPFEPRVSLLRLAISIAVAGLVLAPSGATAQQLTGPSALTLREAVQLARENNPRFLQQQNEVGVARSSVRSARGNLLPSARASSTLGYTASGERRFESVGLGTQPAIYGSDYLVGLNYTLSGATLLQPSVERSRLAATESRVAGAEAELESQVANQYLTVLQAREQIAQSERELARAGEHVRLAEARLQVGAGTPLDVRRAEVQQGRAEIGLVQARNRSATAVLMLSQLIGVHLEPDVELTSEFTIFDPGWSAESLVAMALQNNPALLAARAGSSAAGTAVNAARSSYLPTLSMNMGWRGSVYQAGNIDPLVAEGMEGLQRSFGACLSQNEIRTRVGLAPADCLNPADPAVAEALRSDLARQNSGFPFGYDRQPLSASMTVSLPLFTGFTRQLEVDRARAAAADAGYQVRAEELRLRQEVGTAIRNLETAHRTVSLQERVRANAAEELRLARERFRFGAANSVEVTDAQTNLAQSEKELIDAVYDFHKSLATLEALVGQSLR